MECPESPFFATDNWLTGEDEARSLVLGLIEKSMFGVQAPHLEVSPSQEDSRNSRYSKSLFADEMLEK